MYSKYVLYVCARVLLSLAEKALASRGAAAISFSLSLAAPSTGLFDRKKLRSL
jgi:hypothetical protein